MPAVLKLKFILAFIFVAAIFFLPGSPLIEKAEALTCSISSVPTVTTLNFGQFIDITFRRTSPWDFGSSYAHGLSIYEKGPCDGSRAQTGCSPTDGSTGISTHGTFSPPPNDQLGGVDGDVADTATTRFTAGGTTGTIIIQGEATEVDTSVNAQDGAVCYANLATINIINDTQAPDTIIDSPPNNPPNVDNDTNITFTYHALRNPGGPPEAVPLYQCGLRIDGGAWSAYSACGSGLDDTKSYPPPILSEGHVYDFRVRARDAAGNNDPSPAMYTWTINLVPQPFASPSLTTNCQATDPANPEIHVSWDPSVNAEYYVVQRLDPPLYDLFRDVSPNVYGTIFTDPYSPPLSPPGPPLPNRTYYYRVVAFRAGDPAVYSNLPNPYIKAKACPKAVVDIYVQQSVNSYGQGVGVFGTSPGATLDEGTAEVKYATAYANSCTSDASPPNDPYWDPATPEHNPGPILTEGPVVSLGTLTGPFGPQGYIISCYNDIDPTILSTDTVYINVPAPTPGPWLQINGDAHTNENIDLPIAP